MSVASTALRHSRAAGLVAVALVVAGVIAASLASEQHLPAARVPAHRHHRAQRHAAVAVDDADRDAPDRAGRHGSAGHPPRALDAASAAPRRSPRSSTRATDMVVALQQVQNRVAEIRGELPADSELTVERLTPAVFPVFILSLTGHLADRRTERLRALRHAAGARARAGRRPDRGAGERHARDRGRARSDEADRGGPDGHGRRRRAQGAEPAAAGRPVLRSPASSTSRSASGLWTSVEDIAATPVLVKNGATVRVADIGQVVPGSPDRTLLITGNGRDAVSISISQQIGANILGLQTRRRRDAGGADANAAGRPHHHEGLRPRRVRRDPRSPTSATPS